MRYFMQHKNEPTKWPLSTRRKQGEFIVGKVINLTVSRSVGSLPTWSTWLDDWKGTDAARVNVVSSEDRGAAFTVERQETIASVKNANEVVREQIANNK